MATTAAPQKSRRTPASVYLLEEPTTGLYALETDKGLQLAKQPDATRFSTRADALIAAGDQALEPVRLDA